MLNPLPNGTRVRLKSLNHTLHDASISPLLGRITHEDDGYYLIKLDRPVTYDNSVGKPVPLTTIQEHPDNFEVVEEAAGS